ncbi:hypothetical protein HK102_012089, partial [Quaeritorhiza haematococci]
MDDAFSALVECSMAIVPATDLYGVDDVLRWVSIFWVLEVVKCVVATAESVGVRGEKWALDPRLVAVARQVVEARRASKGKAAKSRVSSQQQQEQRRKSTATAAEGKGKRPVRSEEDVMMGNNGDSITEAGDGEGGEEVEDFEETEMKIFFDWILLHLGMRPELRKKVAELVDPAVLLAVCRSVGLPFLRKSAILLYARFFTVPVGGAVGFDYSSVNTTGGAKKTGAAGFGEDNVFSSSAMSEDEAGGAGESETEPDEYARLLKYLRLPSISTICSRTSIEDPFLARLIA